MRRMVWSSADRNAERSRGAKDLGPPVTSPDERRSVIKLRTASVIPIDCSVNGLPFGASTSAPAFTQRLPHRVVGGVHPGPRGDALDAWILRHPNELAGNDADRQLVTLGDSVDFVLDRTGV